MNFIDLLKLMKHKKASDLFITAGSPSIKVDGKTAGDKQADARAVARLRHGTANHDHAAVRGAQRV
jgi:Tfp pilus assembly ATPase PilU